MYNLFMSNAIVVKNLKKHFGKLHAVDGISFEVKKGEIYGFLGPNGAGKSTTIRCLMGFNRPTDGEIKLLGYDIKDDLEAAKKSIGYLSGNVKLYDNWTGNDHIKLYQDAKGKSKILNQLIDRLEFNPNMKFRHLSSGNKQKLGLILALMHEPKLIIMDEPTVGLDPLLQVEIYNILTEMRDKGSTIFISSHNLPEIERLCDRAAIIKSGKLVAVEKVSSFGSKKLSKINVRLGGKYKISDFQIKGVHSVEQIADRLSISVSGDLNPIMSLIIKYKIKDLEVTHASLEDIFMKFYERED